MKILSFFIGLVFANPMNLLVLNEVLNGDDDSSDNDNLLMLMLMSPGLLGGNQVQADQMSPLLPLLLLDDSDSDSDNTMMMMMLMMQNPTADFNTMLPLLLLEDGSTDFKTLFLLTTVVQNNCQNTNDQMNMLLPLLLLGNDENGDRKRRDTDSDSDDTLKMILLLQTMSQGNRALDMNIMLPFLLMDDATENDNLMLLVLMNSMTGGMDHMDGFGNNFNLLLPLLLGSDDNDGDNDMLFILLAMQSQAPGSAMNSNAMLPLLLMDSGSNNEQLIMFMAMMGNQNCVNPIHIMDRPGPSNQ